VLGIDVDIRLHNRVAIESHPLAARIEMLQGSSTDAAVISKVHEIASRYRRILVCLDSNHTDEHVFAELQAYAPLVSEGSYCVVFDTVIAELPQKLCSNRPWGPGDNPRTAIDRYLAVLGRRETRAVDGDLLLLVPDVAMDGKLVVTVAPHGYLQRIRATPGE
jgi:cephalosporin hydroxylase